MLTFKQYLDESSDYVELPLDQIQPWEPVEHKFRHTIDAIKWKLGKGYHDSVDPIRVEKNVGHVKARSGKIVQTGNRPYVIVDGHHRYIAHEEAGEKKIRVKILTKKELGV